MKNLLNFLVKNKLALFVFGAILLTLVFFYYFTNPISRKLEVCPPGQFYVTIGNPTTAPERKECRPNDGSVTN
jgi:hypothetical protein